MATNEELFYALPFVLVAYLFGVVAFILPFFFDRLMPNIPKNDQFNVRLSFLLTVLSPTSLSSDRCGMESS